MAWLGNCHAQWVVRVLGVWVALGMVAPLWGAAWEEAQEHYLKGRYEASLELAKASLAKRNRNENWWQLQVECQLNLGQYAEARQSLSNALELVPTSVRIRSFAAELYQQMGEREAAEEQLTEINQAAAGRPWDFRDAVSLVALGRAALLLGADPKLVLDRFYDAVRKQAPDLKEAHLAAGRLALDKNDFALAAQVYREALKRFPEDPDFHYGLARALASSQRAASAQYLQNALERNPRHVPSLLLGVDAAIDAEDYRAAESLLKEVFEVNPHHPEAWAYRAVLRHLEADAKGEASAREAALRFWPRNPWVPYRIGLKLSQKYRFREGADYQRLALQSAPTLVSAKIQLAQDLLRLGQEQEGWRMAELAFKGDAYDVTAYNLVTLKKTLENFPRLTNDHFVVRMAPKEATLYGDEVLDHLEQARKVLGARYGVRMDGPVNVEIFPDPKDFGVRTFGMPENPGFLGVCFGRVITANSPASQGGNPINWKAVLWHEMGHVMTLQLTRNRMPRWLSEGISVFEEQVADMTWGQMMQPVYRQMITDGEFTPLSQLSGAFLRAKDHRAVQFAYYQSFLAVEYLVQRYGHERLVEVLHDLGEGKAVEDAIASRMAPLSEVDEGYAAHLQARAKAYAAGIDWEEPRSMPDEDDAAAWQKWLADHPKNLAGRTALVKALLRSERWEEARRVAEECIGLHPAYTGSDSGYHLAAAACRGVGDRKGEREVLVRLAERDADDLGVFLRLTELAEEESDWLGVSGWARRVLAVNPLLPQPYLALGRAGAALGDPRQAAFGWERVLQLDPLDPAEAHFRLAQAWHALGDHRARRQVLEALEQSPRFLAAYELLLRMGPGEERGDAGGAEGGGP